MASLNVILEFYHYFSKSLFLVEKERALPSCSSPNIVCPFCPQHHFWGLCMKFCIFWTVLISSHRPCEDSVWMPYWYLERTRLGLQILPHLPFYVLNIPVGFFFCSDPYSEGNLQAKFRIEMVRIRWLIFSAWRKEEDV